VLDTLAAKAVDVQTTEGLWYTLRIQPYRTLDNVIEGAVLTFMDITEMKQAEEKLLRLAVIVRDSRDAITMQALDGRILAWNEGAARMYGWTEAEALRMNADSRVPKALKADEQDKVHRLGLGKILEPYSTRRLTKTGAVIGISMTATALVDKAGRMYAVATTERQLESKD